MNAQMNIRQAARWAQQKDCVYRIGKDGQPDHMYAVTRIKDQIVVCLGYYDKCADYMNEHKGEYLRNYCLDDVLQEMSESEAESRCYLGQREEGVSWVAC